MILKLVKWFFLKIINFLEWVIEKWVYREINADSIKKDLNKRYKKSKKSKECPFSKEPDGMCPCSMEMFPRGGFQVHNAGKCCRTRMDSAKMAYMVVNDTMHGASSTPELKVQCKESLKRYKENYPDEYEYVFGINDDIGYSANVD